MPPRPPQTPSYRLHRSSGLAVVTLDGRDHYLGPHGSPESHERYRTLVGRWQLGALLPGSGPRTDDLMLNELFVRYWKHVRQYYRKHDLPTEEQRMIRTALRPLLEYFGSMRVSEFGPLNLKAVRASLIARGHARTYVNQTVGRMKRMFRWAVENELAPPGTLHALNAVGGLRRGRSEARETEPVRPADESLISAALPFMSPQVAAMVQVQMVTGMRPGEVVCMCPRDIDRSVDPWLYTPQSHKTEHHGRARRVYLGPRAQQLLSPYLLRPEDAPCFSPAEAESQRLKERHADRRVPMSCGNRPGSNRRRRPRCRPGVQYTVDSYRRAIERACLRAHPLPADADAESRKAWRKEHCFHPHQLRHNAATILARSYGIEAAQVVLGHATLSVTGIYAERDFAKAAAIMKQVG